MEFIDHKKPMDNFDKIEFNSADEVKKLLAWRDNNKDLVRNFNFVLEKGVIVNKFNGVYIIFEKQNEKVYIDMLVTNKNVNEITHFHTIYWYYEKGNVEILHPLEEYIKEDEEFWQENNQSLITVVASLMAYMEHNRENRESIQTNKIVTNKTKKKKNGKKKNTRKITRVIYNLNVINETSTQKREYNFDDSKSWTVRGHWRNLANGKKVWIKPYKKGNSEDESEPATYKF